MQFKDILGQKELIGHLLTLIRKHHLPHALLLSGPEGSGGMPLALATAQYIMCSNRSEDDSCGECASCTKVSRLQHPDVHFSFPTYKMEATPPVSDDFIREFRTYLSANPYANDTDWLKFLDTEKQGNITAKECREIIRKLSLRSFESEYKVLIMWYPEYLEKEGNILLKLIEEPTDKTLLFFVSTSAEDILPTIQSRTQLFPLKRLSDEDIREALLRKGLAPDLATQYARLAEGNYNTALSLCTHEEDDWVNLLRSWFNWIYANKGIELVQWVQEIEAKTKESKKKFLAYVLQLLEHLLRYQTMQGKQMALLDSEMRIIQTLLDKGITPSRVSEMSRLLEDSIYEIERNANTKIMFHSLSLRIQKIVLRRTGVPAN